jgi:molybdopterin converting factor small subunit
LRVGIPDPLLSYTGRQRQVEASGRTVGELLHDLDRRYPGIRFRLIDEQDGIRPHMRLFVNRAKIRSLDVALEPDDEVHILQALSGG